MTTEHKPHREPLWFYFAMAGVYLVWALMLAWFLLFAYFVWLIW